LILLHPIYLILLLPLAVALVVWGFRSPLLRVLRGFTYLFAVLALAGLSLYLPRQAGTVVVVADRSHSMPIDAESLEKEAIDLLQQGMSADDRLVVVGFGKNAVVEHVPPQGRFPGFQGEVGRDASNLAEAMEMGLGLIPRGAPGRLLVLSDGQWTGQDPVQAGVKASGRSIAIDHRVLQRSITGDVAIARIDAPSSVSPNESFLVTAWVYASTAQEVGFEFRRGPHRLAAGKRQMEAGLNRLTFRDQAVEAGVQAYTLSITPKETDAIPENNVARLLVGVQGPRPLLVVPSSPDSNFPDLLEAGGLKIHARAPEQCAWTIEELSKYSGVILENVPADKIGHAGMEMLAAWVQQTGAGLMLTGGRASYGPGGYFKSPLDPLLPVSMELRQEHRKLSLAIVVALDRSGSMAMPAGGGRVKMDLANLGTVQVLDLLNPADEFGCIAIDTEPHIIAPLGRVTNKAPIREKILRINSEGGGIYIYEALVAAYEMVKGAKAGTKHIILFSDAADAEEPKAYKEIVAQCRAEGITISVIGLGKDTDVDAELLKDIAARGGGRVFFSDQPDELPRLFAQDTFVVARSSFLDERTDFKTVAGLSLLTNKEYNPPAFGGYNLCYLRPKATLAAVTLDEYKAPVVAAWQSGAGRVLSYTGEADGKYTGPIAEWKDVGDFYTSMARWTAGKTDVLPGGVVVTQERQKGIAAIRLHLDPERKQDAYAKPPDVAVLRALPDRKPAIEKKKLEWTGPDTLSLDVPLYGTETILATIDVPGHGPVPLPPTCLPYSPEYEPPPVRSLADKKGDSESSTQRWGPAALEHLSKMTGGRERIELPSIWKDMPRHPRLVPLGMWFLIAAVVTLLLEVLQRLTGILSFGIRLPKRRVAAATVAAETAEEPIPTVRETSAPPMQPVPPPVEEPRQTELPPKLEPQSGGLLEAMRQVKEKKRR
jgi:Mg-chelatase subunit ChlD